MKMPMIVTPRQAIVSAVLFGFHGINLLKNLVSRELLRILENFHFSISISKHFDFTFHFSKKSESILFSLCTSRKRVKHFFFTLHLSKKSESFLFSLFTSRISKTHSRWSLLTEPNLPNPNYWSKQSTPGSVVPLAMFTLLHLDSQEFKGEVVFSLNQLAEHLNIVLTLFTH